MGNQNEMKLDIMAAGGKEKMSKDAWITLILVVLAWIGTSMSNGAWTQSIVDIREEFGISSTVIGYINSGFMLGGAIGCFILPIVADRIGRKWGMMLCVALATVGCLFTGFAGSVPMLLLWRFFTVAGQSAEWSIGSAQLSESVPSSRRGFASGIQQMGSPISTFIVASLVAFMLSRGLGWRWNFYICAIPVVVVIFIAIFGKETSRWIENHQQKKSGSEDGKEISWREMFKPQYRKYMIIAIILHILGGLWAQGNGIWFATGMRQDFGVDSITAANLTSWMWFIGIFGYFLAGPISDKLGRRRTFVMMISILLFGVMIMNFFILRGITNLTMIYGAVGIWGFGLGVHSVMIALSSEILPSHVRAAGLGLAIGAGRLASVVAQPIIGHFVDTTYVVRILLVIVVIYALSLFAVYSVPETANKSLEEIVK